SVAMVELAPRARRPRRVRSPSDEARAGEQAGLSLLPVAPPEGAACRVREVQLQRDRREGLTGPTTLDHGPTDREGDGAGHHGLLEGRQGVEGRSLSLPETMRPGRALLAAAVNRRAEVRRSGAVR